jgi:hypothetical protein
MFGESFNIRIISPLQVLENILPVVNVAN